MKILTLSKRHYTNLDLIDDKFGRLRELPMALAHLGHEVSGICMSYRGKKEGLHTDITEEAKVQWYSLGLERLFPFGTNNYLSVLNRLYREKTDLIWASSDALQIILGAWIAKKYKRPFVADLYDNYESFLATRLPGIKWVFRRALKSADGITCVSEPLADYVKENIGFKGPVKIIENAVPRKVFYPMEKSECRRRFHLPENGFYIGTAGAISKSRGIEVLIKAFQALSETHNNIRLVLAGPSDKGIIPHQNRRIHYLGVLHPDKIPAFLSALDVQVICNTNSAFGKYCFPQKFYEAVACHVPVVAAAVGAMAKKLKHHPDHLFEAGNETALKRVLLRQMETPTPLHMVPMTWDIRGKKLENFFKEILTLSKKSQYINRLSGE